MKYLALLVLLLGGCADLMQATRPTDAGPGLGTHSYTITKAGDIKVDVHSIYGGPAFTVSTDAEGVRTISVTPASRIQVEKLIEVLKIP